MDKPALALAPRALFACLGAGLLLGRLVVTLSVRHHRSSAGLLVALLCLGLGATAVTLLLTRRHAQRHAAAEAPVSAPMQAWLIALGAGVLAGIHLDGLFPA